MSVFVSFIILNNNWIYVTKSLVLNWFWKIESVNDFNILTSKVISSLWIWEKLQTIIFFKNLL